MDLQNSCPRCTKGNLLTDSNTGEKFCDKCGYVAIERLENSGPDWRIFSGDEFEKKCRTGVPSSLAIHDKGLSTIIDSSNKDAFGRTLSYSLKNIVERLRLLDGRSRSSTTMDRNLAKAFGEVNKLKYKIALSGAVMEKAAYIYRKTLEMGLMQGRHISGIVAAATYIACREMDTPRTLNEIADAINVKKTEVSRCCRILIRTLDIKMPVIDPVSCVGRIASKCNLNEKIKRTAVEILENAKINDLTAGRNPMGMAAASLYISSVINGENASQKEIAKASGITEGTIRNRYSELCESLGLMNVWKMKNYES